MTPNTALLFLLAVLIVIGLLAAWRVLQGLARVGALLALIAVAIGAIWWLVYGVL